MSPGTDCMTLFDSTVDGTVMDDHWLDFLDEDLIVGENKFNDDSSNRSSATTTHCTNQHHQEQSWVDADSHKMLSSYSCDEDTNAVGLKLLELEREMLKVSPNEAYLKALRLNPGYVTNKDFRTMFLRSQKFDVHAAATHMAHHFETKRRLFGDLVLERDIRQSDLSPQDLKILSLGAFQVFPHRDSANRPVVAIFWDLISKNNITYDGLARPLFYFYMKLAGSAEQAQRLGMVWVMYSNTSTADFSSLLNAQTQVCSSVPSWVAAVHICSESPAQHQPLKMDSSARFGVRQHAGSALEVAFQLLVFGIRTSEGPMGTDGVWNTTRHKQWLDQMKGAEEAARKRVLQQRRTEQASTSSSSVNIVPEKFDILMGRTKRSLHHTGNSRMIQLCEMHFELYNSANKLHKTRISDQIVSLIHESGGRFLKWNDEKGTGKWVLETDMLVARNKVAHCFRHVRARFARGGVVVTPESSPSPSHSPSSLDYYSTPNFMFSHEGITSSEHHTATKRSVEHPTREQPTRRSKRMRNNYYYEE
eukprot:Nitzschia sp. Nitz4//scaffold83_size84149//16863//18461//NITZ4_005167-RA/size84149-processed-gene-0.51-mRNA-1//-1//CDS//3329558926//9192//frame0